MQYIYFMYVWLDQTMASENEGTGVFRGIEITEEMKGRFVLVSKGKTVAISKSLRVVIQKARECEPTPLLLSIPKEEMPAMAF